MMDTDDTDFTESTFASKYSTHHPCNFPLLLAVNPGLLCLMRLTCRHIPFPVLSYLADIHSVFVKYKVADSQISQHRQLNNCPSVWCYLSPRGINALWQCVSCGCTKCIACTQKAYGPSLVLRVSRASVWEQCEGSGSYRVGDNGIDCMMNSVTIMSSKVSKSLNAHMHFRVLSKSVSIQVFKCLSNILGHFHSSVEPIYF